jgi:hypothetical protein
MSSAIAGALFAATVSVAALRSQAVPRGPAGAGSTLLMPADPLIAMPAITLRLVAVSVPLAVRDRPVDVIVPRQEASVRPESTRPTPTDGFGPLASSFPAGSPHDGRQPRAHPPSGARRFHRA